MRGVVAGGMVSALEEMEMLKCFDSIHGSSAGACAGAYFAAGQARLGTSIYYENINNSKFINFARVFAGKPMMSTSYLIDQVMHVEKPLDVSKLLLGDKFLYIVTTETKTARACVFDAFRDADYFFNVLRATVTMPIIAGHAVVIDDHPLVDGGIVQQIPLHSAINVGATHVLVLLTRTRGELERPERMSKLSLDYLGFRLMYGSALAARYARRNTEINAVLHQVMESESDQAIKIDTLVRPTSATYVDRLSMDAPVLRAAALEARDTVVSYLTQQSPSLNA